MTQQESLDTSLNTDPEGGHPYGHIKSFVFRRGHISQAQEQAYERGMPIWGIAYDANQTIQFDQVFGRNAPVWLEIGCGMGETTAKIAAAHPQVNYLGVEVYKAGVGALIKRIEEQDLNNLRIMSHDVVDILNHMIPDNSLDRVLIYFPDPWRKARHHKRRLIQGPFIEHLCSKMKSGAVLHCATDWENYAHQMLEVLSAEPQLVNLADGFSERPESRPLTKFENRGLKLGHGVWDLLFTKR